MDKHKENKKSKSSKGPVHSSSKSSQKNKEKSANGGSLADKKMAELMAIIAEAGKDVREICENYLAEMRTLESERDNRSSE